MFIRRRFCFLRQVPGLGDDDFWKSPVFQGAQVLEARLEEDGVWKVIGDVRESTASNINE